MKIASTCAVVGAALICAGVVSPSVRQQAPQAPSTFRSTVDVVRVEASVLDKDRHPVRGLRAEDFTVLEDGRERPVVAFAPVELAAAPTSTAETATWVRDAPRDVVDNSGADAGRLIVIVFDWSIRFYDQPLARRIALAAVQGLGPGDEATVLFTKQGGGRPQGFTADRALLRAAINQPFAFALTSPHPDLNKRIIDPEGYESGDCLCGLCTLDGLTQLGKSLRTVSERPKVVLFIGTYVRTFEAMRPTAVQPAIPGRITPSFATMPGTECPGRLRDAREAFERTIRAANVTVHVLDPVGVDTDVSTPLGPGRIRERLDSLPVIADITGGRTVANTDAPEAHVASILDESSAYYVLGFTPASSTKRDTTRRIEVRMRSRGLTVRARNQYNLAEQPTSAASGREVLARAVAHVLPARDVPLEMSAVPMIAGRRLAAVLVGRLGAGAARPTAMLSAALTPRAVPVVSRRIAIPPAAGGTQPAGLGLVSALALEPGSYEIRVATESPGGATGSVHTFVDIPDFRQAPLSMSGILLHVAPEEAVASRDEIDDALPFVPTARRTFASGDTVSAFVQVSQGTARKDALQSVTMLLRISDTSDAAVRNRTGALTPAEFVNNRTANSRLGLPLQGLPPGQYLLTLEATLGERRAERSLRFEVR